MLVDYPAPDSDVAFSYDNGGRRLTMTDAVGVTTRTYDSVNRTTTVEDPSIAITGYGYDAVGNPTRLTYPDGSAVNYTYDNTDRLTGIARPNGVNITYAYDNANQLPGLAHKLDAQILGSHQYTHNPVGNLSQAIEQTNEHAGSSNTDHCDHRLHLWSVVPPDGSELQRRSVLSLHF